MGKKRTEINPIRAERLKTLIKREKITQTDLCNRIHLSQQAISNIITMKCALTETNAKEVIKEFPKYRLEWLLGYADYMTWDDYWDAHQNMKDRIADGLWGMIEKTLNKHGESLRFVHRADEHVDSTQRARADCYYSITDNDGNELKRMTSIEMIRFEMQIQEYCDFMVERHLLKEVNTDGDSNANGNKR